jgi:hypothetical protein
MRVRRRSADAGTAGCGRSRRTSRALPGVGGGGDDSEKPPPPPHTGIHALAFSIGTYAYGRIFDKPRLSHLGMDLLRAEIIAELIVQPLKLATRCERTDGSNFQSFPSAMQRRRLPPQR